MRTARLRGDMGEQSNIKQKVEAKNPALRKKRAPYGARGASGATGYLPSPRDEGRKGSRGRYVLSGTHLTHVPWNRGEPGTIEGRTKDA